MCDNLAVNTTQQLFGAVFLLPLALLRVCKRRVPGRQYDFWVALWTRHASAIVFCTWPWRLAHFTNE